LTDATAYSPFAASASSLATLILTAFFAGMSTAAPVDGLRPVRAGFCSTFRLKSPAIRTSSPFVTVALMTVCG